MNLLAKTDQLWTMCVKQAIDQKFRMEQIGQEFDYMDHANKLWDQQLDRIRNQLAPKYHELEAVLRTANIIKNKDLNSLNGKHCFITLRPEPGAINLHRFIFDVKKFADKDLFLSGEYVFEQKGYTEEEMGIGFHAHLLMSCKDYVQVKDIINAYKFIKYNCVIQIGDKKDKKKKFLRTEKDLEFVKNYIRGFKHNEEKEKCVIIDKIWRKKIEIEEIYTK